MPSLKFPKAGVNSDNKYIIAFHLLKFNMKFQVWRLIVAYAARNHFNIVV